MKFLFDITGGQFLFDILQAGFDEMKPKKLSLYSFEELERRSDAIGVRAPTHTRYEFTNNLKPTFTEKLVPAFTKNIPTLKFNDNQSIPLLAYAMKSKFNNP